MRTNKKKCKKSCAPLLLVVLGAIVLVLAFVPAKIIMILLAVLLIVIGICMCF